MEIEVKYKVKNAEGLRSWLEQNTEKKSSKRTIDKYYSPPHKDYLEPELPLEWLRLRNTEGKCSFDYKNWHIEKGEECFHCDEFITGITSLEAFQKILRVLDFKELIEVDKNRTKYVLDDIEFCLDEVKQLGWYLEMEYIGKNEDLDQIMGLFNKKEKQLTEFLMGKDRRGYPYRLLEKNKLL